MEKRNQHSTRLEELYKSTIAPQLQKELKISNYMAVPRILKIVLNMGVKDAVSDSKSVQKAADLLRDIACQKPVRTIARKSIAGFKIREGMPLGTKVTLRGARMYHFLDKLIGFALPKTKDFQGITDRGDGRGGYNLGIADCSIFPEADAHGTEMTAGMNITIHTNASDDKAALLLLKLFGMPFKKKANSN